MAAVSCATTSSLGSSSPPTNQLQPVTSSLAGPASPQAKPTTSRDDTAPCDSSSELMTSSDVSQLPNGIDSATLDSECGGRTVCDVQGEELFASNSEAGQKIESLV